jgi:hypothetical protein
MKAIDDAKQYSEQKLAQLREALRDVVPKDEMIVINGSYARREASAGSDIDFYILTRGDAAEPKWAEAVRQKIAEIVPIEPAEGGAFARVEPRDTLLRNIGGENDDNQNLTRRMLLLLEGEWLSNVAMTADRTREQKISILQRLFDMPVIDRMKEICGNAGTERVLASYSHFLSRLEDVAVRDHLKSLSTASDRKDELFRELKNEGHNFTRELLKLFEGTFDSTHPIRRAIIF